jgi:GNAT superfamily N-acetyltransferase
MIIFERADLVAPNHGKAILTLLEEYAKGHTGGRAPLPTKTRANLIGALQGRNDCHVVIGFEGEIPVGVAICFEGFSTFACQPLLNIHDFVIASAYRGRGFAAMMLAKVEEVARELGCGKLTLEVLEGNKVAKYVYEKFGFAPYELDPGMGRALFLDKKIS